MSIPMAEEDKRDNVNALSRPRAEPEVSRQAETEAIETAMKTGKDRRVKRKTQDERTAEEETVISAESTEHDTREHSSRTSTVHEEKADSESIKESRTKSRTDRKKQNRKRQERKAKTKASSKLIEGEDSPKESKIIYVDKDEIIPGRDMSARRLRRLSAATVNETAHRKITDEEDENVGVEASHHAEMLGEDNARRGSELISNKLREKPAAEITEREKTKASEMLGDDAKKHAEVNAKQNADEKSKLLKLFQKKKIKRQYAVAKYAEHKSEQIAVQHVMFTDRVKAAIEEAFTSKSRLVLIVGILWLMLFLIMTAVSSCTASIHGMTSSIIATTYPSSDEDIYQVEDAYADMEARLNSQVCRMESTHPGYDEYQFQVDEISHDPYHLISYLTTKYGEFTYRQVKDELKEIFQEQYSISTSISTKQEEVMTSQIVDGEEIETTETRTIKTFRVTMTNHGLDSVLRARMTRSEGVQYELLNMTYGNRDYLFNHNSLPTYGAQGGGNTYQVPPEALSDTRFARMLNEAEKYLGYPYVWGGSSPVTSFDCSGYVSWVINHCGNGWSYGRLGAEGLRRICTAVSTANAKPGDLIFFQNTYPCGPGASHVGIYVGNGMMIHCGNPIQYTSIRTAYWQQHFLSYGRLP